jgi:Na+-translocating ferredoxin:NAD+ oxidoreductase RnfC subunit
MAEANLEKLTKTAVDAALDYEYEGQTIREWVEDLKKLKVTLCMNCGCCSYACPAHRPLAETNQLAKALIPRK